MISIIRGKFHCFLSWMNFKQRKWYICKISEMCLVLSDVNKPIKKHYFCIISAQYTYTLHQFSTTNQHIIEYHSTNWTFYTIRQSTVNNFTSTSTKFCVVLNALQQGCHCAQWYALYSYFLFNAKCSHYFLINSSRHITENIRQWIP